MKIVDIHTAVPDFSITQAEALGVLTSHRDLSRQESIFYKRFLSEASVHKRHFAIQDVSDCFVQSQDTLIGRFERQSVGLSSKALASCLTALCLDPSQIALLITATCTGYICPGISSHLIEHLDLPESLFVLDMVGMGCGAALPMLRTLTQSRLPPEKTAVGVCTEVCSATIHWLDDVEQILSNSIFGDGSAAVVLGDLDRPGWQVHGFHFRTIPELRDKLRFATYDSKLRNRLSSDVPTLVATHLKQVVDELLEMHSLTPAAVRFWPFHSGGRRVIDCIQEKLCFSDEATQYTRAVLRSFGNLPSPTVLFVLKRVWDHGNPKPGDLAVLASFGAGLSIYTALLEYT